MSKDWPEPWIPATEKMNSEPSYTNDNGIRSLFGKEADERICMENVPPHLENRA
jgi:hypothetical protein